MRSTRRLKRESSVISCMISATSLEKALAVWFSIDHINWSSMNLLKRNKVCTSWFDSHKKRKYGSCA